MNNPEKKKTDIDQLKKDHPNDPRMGQGYNDARGEIPDDEEHPTHKNIKNNAGPEQKRTDLPANNPSSQPSRPA